MLKILIYLSIMTSLIGASFLSFDLSLFQLSTFRLIIMCSGLIIITQVLLNNGRVKISSANNNSYSIKFMLIWLTYAIGSLGWVKDYGDWFHAVYFIGLGVMCVILYTVALKTSAHILVAFRIMSVMMIIHNVIGWYEVSSGNYLFLIEERVAKYSYYGYPVSVFFNTNNFGLFMLFSTFINYICLVNARMKITKVIYLSTIFSSIYLLAITDSRASLIGLLTASILFVSLTVISTNWRNLIITLLATLSIVVFVDPSFLDRLSLLIGENLNFNFASNYGSDVIRLNLIKNGILFVVKTCGFGTGAGNIEYWMDNYGVYYTSDIVNIHNWWMELLVGYGILVFFLYLFFFLKLFRGLLLRYRTCNSTLDKSISLGILCCMAGFVIASISSSSNISAEWLWVFWAITIAYQGIELYGDRGRCK